MTTINLKDFPEPIQVLLKQYLERDISYDVFSIKLKEYLKELVNADSTTGSDESKKIANDYLDGSISKNKNNLS